LRLSLQKWLSLRGDVAYVIDGDGVRDDGDVRGHFGVVLSF
jgi:hypothetical protein